MIDLNECADIPQFEIKLGEEIHSFEPLQTAYEMQNIESDDPKVIHERAEKVFGLSFNLMQGVAVAKQFFEFIEKEIDPITKKVLGRELFSTTTTASTPEDPKLN